MEPMVNVLLVEDDRRLSALLARRLSDEAYPASRRVHVSGREVDLTAREFDLLECLLRNTGRVLTRAELKDAVWDFDFEAETKVVDLYVHYLRKKLGDAGGLIETVRSVGYAVGR